MFTNNYIALRHNFFMGLPGAGSSSFGIYGKSMVDVNGSAFNLYSSTYAFLTYDIGYALRMGGRCTSLGQAGVYFGSGSTPATREDYTLESLITSGLTVNSSGLKMLDEGEGKYSFSGLYVLTNNTDADINIYEIGCFSCVNSSSSAQNIVMMDRTVQTEPITIKAGETKLVTYKITFNQTLNVEA